jgi:hypothetical protein
MNFRSFHLPALLLLAICLSVSAQPGDLSVQGLKGRVKRIDEDMAVVKEKDGVRSESGKQRSRTLTFDDKGRMEYEWVRVADLTPSEHYYSYLKDNRRLERIIVQDPFANSSRSPHESYSLCIYRFEAAENAIYYDYYTSNGSNKNSPVAELDTATAKYKYIFDPENRLLTRFLMSSKGEVVSTDNYLYDPKAQSPFQRVLYLLGNSRPQIIDYTYELDLQGNWIKETALKTMANAEQTKETTVKYRKISYYKN